MKRHNDRGSILVLVLVVSVVMALVVAALATYATTTLRYGQVVEAAADRLATAQAGMDNTLESIERGESPCVVSTVETNGAVGPFDLGTQINGIEPSITCTRYDGNVTPVDSYAVIITGENGQSGELLEVTGGGAKKFSGNVFLNAVPSTATVHLGADLEITDGNLKYYDKGTACLPGGTVIGSGGHEISFTTGYDLECSTPSLDWEDEFALLRPTQPSTFTGVASYADDTAGCRVFTPGTYTAAPTLAEWNYFQGGNYHFKAIGEWAIDDQWVLAGYPGTAGPDIEDHDVDNSGNLTHSVNWHSNPCRTAAEADATGGGAAFYFGGDSHIIVESRGSLEVTGRPFGLYNLGIFALEGSATVRSTLTGNDRVVQTAGGNGKQLSIHGLVWAPYTGLEFSNLANDVTAALTGGAVVAELSVGAANAAGLQIAVETQDPQRAFTIESAATNTGTTVVVAEVLYQNDGTNYDYAILSRRVQEITPE
jgi:hypothetical protein